MTGRPCIQTDYFRILISCLLLIWSQLKTVIADTHSAFLKQRLEQKSKELCGGKEIGNSSRSKIETKHRNHTEWEKNVLQNTIDKLTSELEEQTGEGKHLLGCIKGEVDMIKIFKIFIDETETRPAIDVAQLLKTANEKT